MAEHSIILRKTEEARLDQLYQTKCDEVSFDNINKIGWFDGHNTVLFISHRAEHDIK